jgi:hypothetical protein
MVAMLRHSSAQRRQASAQRWQWSCWCLAHSSPQAWHTSAQAAQIARAFSLPRAMAAAATAHSSAQSMSRAMQRAIIFTSSSCRQAAAQWLHAVAQSRQARMQEANRSCMVDPFMEFSVWGAAAVALSRSSVWGLDA